MNIKLDVLKTATPEAGIQLAGYTGAQGLYVGTQTDGGEAGSIVPNTVTTLSATAPGSLGLPNPAQLSFSALLPTPPGWALALTAAGTGELAVSQFGGGWNGLAVSTLTGGQLATSYSYDIEDTVRPRYVLNTSATPAKQQFLSAIFSGYQLGLIGLQTQDGQQVPHVSGIVGSETAPVSQGRVYGDLSAGLPTSLTVAWLPTRLVGPLAPNGALCGSLNLAPYDVNGDKLGTVAALLPGVDICDFDLAVGGGTLCVLAITGTGAPVLALFDEAGKALEAPTSPVGSWSNAGHWAAGPTVMATPGETAAFSFAFTEMADGQAVAVQAGSVSPTITP